MGMLGGPVLLWVQSPAPTPAEPGGPGACTPSRHTEAGARTSPGPPPAAAPLCARPARLLRQETLCPLRGGLPGVLQGEEGGRARPGGAGLAGEGGLGIEGRRDVSRWSRRGPAAGAGEGGTALGGCRHGGESRGPRPPRPGPCGPAAHGLRSVSVSARERALRFCGRGQAVPARGPWSGAHAGRGSVPRAAARSSLSQQKMKTCSRNAFAGRLAGRGPAPARPPLERRAASSRLSRP